MSKNILAIVEGEKADYKLMKHLFSMFYQESYYVWPYKTNLYALYNTFELNDKEDFESLDTIQVLLSVEKDEKIRKMLKQKFTDIILIFDFDLQDSNFSREKIEKLKRVFNESTENGNLYINYPMVEAFKHLACQNDKEYLNLQVSYKDLKEGNYKKLVSRVSFETNYEKYSREMCLSVWGLNIVKTNYIMFQNKKLPENEEEYFKINLGEVLNYQCELLEKLGCFFVLCTCIFFFVDNRPRYFLKEIGEILNEGKL